jgi:branched-chain amino acid transport system ATP-binding protein
MADVDGSIQASGTTPASALLELRGVRAGYGSSDALAGIDLHVGRGEVVGVVGPNGAGKTTLLRTICGQVRLRSGEVRFDGARVDGRRPEELARAGIAHVPQGRHLFPDMTVLENVEVAARARFPRRRAAEEVAQVAELFPIVRDRAAQKAGTLSGGQQQMVAIARGLVSRPALLLLDEPSLGLAPAVIEQLVGYLADLVGGGQTVLLAEQNVGAAAALCSQLYVIGRGQVISSGPSVEILASGAMTRAYFGADEGPVVVGTAP